MMTNIFIVDDHPLVREWLSALISSQDDLTMAGEADSAATALAAMLDNPPDVAIIDLSLKSSSGLDLIKDMTEHLPGTQAIVLTMYDEAFYAERALRAGARGYIMKHEATDRILEAIRAVQSGRVFTSPQLMERLTEKLIGRSSKAPMGDVSILSDRELDVFRRLGTGQTTRQIARDLNISIKTVQAYCARIKEKLAIENGAELVIQAVRWVELHKNV